MKSGATESGMTCICPDFVYRDGKCKHIMATIYYLEVQKETPNGTVTKRNTNRKGSRRFRTYLASKEAAKSRERFE